MLVDGITASLEREPDEDSEQLALNITQSWILKHVEIYDHFEGSYIYICLPASTLIVNLSFESHRTIQSLGDRL